MCSKLDLLELENFQKFILPRRSKKFSEPRYNLDVCIFLQQAILLDGWAMLIRMGVFIAAFCISCQSTQFFSKYNYFSWIKNVRAAGNASTIYIYIYLTMMCSCSDFHCDIHSCNFCFLNIKKYRNTLMEIINNFILYWNDFTNFFFFVFNKFLFSI